MTTYAKFFQKTFAIALAAICLTLPLTNIVAAAPKNDAPPQRQEQRVERNHDRKDSNHHCDNKRNDKHQPPRHENKNNHDKPRPPHQEKRPEHRSAPPRDTHKHSSNGKAVGGFILGAILGAVIANNT